MQQRKHAAGHRADVGVRILLSRAIEPDARIAAKPEFTQLQRRMLTRGDQRWFNPAPRQRLSDRRQLDGFRPGPDNQPYIRVAQPSP
jgi:hypothetical protein